MVQISNKPNVGGIKKASEEAEYSSKLIAREGKLTQQIIWGDSEEKLFCCNYLILVEAGRKFHETVIFIYSDSESAAGICCTAVSGRNGHVDASV